MPPVIYPLKLTLNVTQTPTLTGDQFSSGGGDNCPDTSLNKITVFCLLITKKLKFKEKITPQLLF